MDKSIHRVYQSELDSQYLFTTMSNDLPPENNEKKDDNYYYYQEF